jgi:hypothetical protein
MRLVSLMVAGLLLSALVPGCLTGCARNDDGSVNMEPIRAGVQAAQDLGVRAKLTAIWGDSHAAGITWNMTGSHGVAEFFANWDTDPPQIVIPEQEPAEVRVMLMQPAADEEMVRLRIVDPPTAQPALREEEDMVDE